MAQMVGGGQLLEFPYTEPELGAERQLTYPRLGQTNQQRVNAERKVGRIRLLNVDQSQDYFAVFVFVNIFLDQR